MSTTTYTGTTPITTIRVAELGAKLPRGFRFGAHVAKPGRAYYYVIRNRDGASVLCPLTPAEDELLSMSEMREALHAACDAPKD
jgi:hypothetical protein